jgi:hypothetical protein
MSVGAGVEHVRAYEDMGSIRLENLAQWDVLKILSVIFIYLFIHPTVWYV